MVKDRKQTIRFKIDEHPRATTAEKLAELRPAFDPGRMVTASNSSGINDGAAAVVLATDSKVEKSRTDAFGADCILRAWRGAGAYYGNGACTCQPDGT